MLLFRKLVIIVFTSTVPVPAFADEVCDQAIPLIDQHSKLLSDMYNWLAQATTENIAATLEGRKSRSGITDAEKEDIRAILASDADAFLNDHQDLYARCDIEFGTTAEQ